MTRALCVTAVALLSTLAASPASAQNEELVPPRILVIFDTSGSMAWQLDVNESAGGDGSREFPTHEESRIYAAKEALRSVLLSIGESEAQFGLMRYSQREGLRANRFPEEYPRPINYDGQCDPGGDVLVPFGESNVGELVSWLDHEERFPENKELRADGGTPLAGSLQEAYRWLREEVLPNDINADCRIYSIILLTDGVETCAEPNEPQACDIIESLQAVPNGHDEGVTEVTTYTVGFGPLQGAQAAALDEMAFCAGVNDGQAFRAADRQDLQLAFGRIIGLALPIEVCDGRDNDCDGLVDEGVRNACGECGPPPEELCNGLDDDCDREVDEGVRNSCGECAPEPVEVCDGIDNDCDGILDEGACIGPCAWREEICDGVDNDCDLIIDNGVTRPCGTDVGECELGFRQCEGGVFLQLCEGGVEPVDEECDGLDNDCNGIIDGHSRTCGDGLGECASGRQICIGGEWGQCLGAKQPTDEVCNNKDDDCDGEVDEGVRNSCGDCGAAPIEICDGDDDDCDGRIDDGAQCQEGFSCVQGECTRPCFHGECPLGQRCIGDICVSDPCRIARCRPGTVCDNETGGCVDPCDGKECPGVNQVCDLGECVVSSCRHLGCPPGSVCRDGICEDHPCTDVACEADEYCKDGECVAGCQRIQCNTGQRCIEGECVAIGCVDAQCPPGQVCVLGECAQDPCGGISCPVATECLEGECIDPLCRFVLCPPGVFCDEGHCIPGGHEGESEGEGECADPSWIGCEVAGCDACAHCVDEACRCDLQTGECVVVEEDTPEADPEGHDGPEGEAEAPEADGEAGGGENGGCGCDGPGGVDEWTPTIIPRR